MALFLASVRDPAEAEIAVLAGADVIDVKDPAQGSLGAVDRGTSMAIVAAVAGRRPVSATIGDVPMDPVRVREAVADRVTLGVDFIKIGLFPGGDPRATLAALEPLAQRKPLVLVLFADAMPPFDAVAAAAAMGARGVMLDTREKCAGSLRTHLDHQALSLFVADAKAHGLMVGLAGSLASDDIAPLLALRPDLLGFRGAVCQGSRSAALDRDACAAIRALIPREGPRAPVAELPEADAPALC
jgi:(5-formylfuran-3-yl)methyl phosphate synthase